MKLMAITALFLSLITTAHIYSTAWAYPNTFVNGTRVSVMRSSDIDAYRKSVLSTPFRMRVQNREYPYSYTDFGVEINSELLFQDVFEPNRRKFPLNILALLESVSKPRYIQTPLVFTRNMISL
jgi:hypothetical protein